jgi:transcriptional regulator with XRE-family HTH domain
MLGLSQAALAKKIGFSSQQISNLENTVKPVQVQTELAIECLLRRSGKWDELN